MKILTFLSLLFLLVFTNNVKSAESDVIQHLVNISVKIDAGRGTGSGTIFTRKDWTGTNDITFIWTCAHVLRQNESSFSMLFFGPRIINSPITDRVMVIQNLYDKDGAVCGSTNRLAKLIKYSSYEKDQDLALLQLDGPFFNKDTAVFNLNGKPARIGTPLLTVASPLGLTQNFSRGDISMVGSANINSNVLDQTTCVVYPGSSGSGVFTTDGKYIGMAELMSEPNVNYIIPVRRIQQWAKKEHVEWALDPSIPMPSESQFKAIKLGDSDRNNPIILTNCLRSLNIGKTNSIPRTNSPAH